MLKTIQIIAFLQGLFVLYTLFKKRNDYKKVTFWLLFGCLVSVLFYVVGDDQYNLFVKGADFLLFESSLFVTFLFLFFKYYKSGESEFANRDFFYFLPNIIYIVIEVIESTVDQNIMMIEILEIIIRMTYVVYLMHIVFSVITTKKRHWVISVVIPIVVLFILATVNDVLEASNIEKIKILNAKNLSAILFLTIVFLFYFIAYKLLHDDQKILPKKAKGKYKNSNLKSELIDSYKTKLIHAMEVDKMYLNGKLSIQDVSGKLDIPRQYISEVLNEHMKISFQDFVNQYRVEEFILRLKNDQNNNYTLLGVAQDVGFNSKSSFNATFKKIKGLTPTEFKKSLE